MSLWRQKHKCDFVSTFFYIPSGLVQHFSMNLIHVEFCSTALLFIRLFFHYYYLRHQNASQNASYIPTGFPFFRIHNASTIFSLKHPKCVTYLRLLFGKKWNEKKKQLWYIYLFMMQSGTSKGSDCQLITQEDHAVCVSRVSGKHTREGQIWFNKR